MNHLVSADELRGLLATDSPPVLLDCGFELSDPDAGARAWAAEDEAER